MAQLRVLIVPTVQADRSVLLRLSHLAVDEGNNIAKNEDGSLVVLHSEEAVIGHERAGCGYVSNVGFEAGEVNLLTFFVDPKGLRHFIAKAEAGDLTNEGLEAGLKMLKP